MRSFQRFSTLRTTLSVGAMVILLACGTWLILSKVIDQVAARHTGDLARSHAGLLRPGLFDPPAGGETTGREGGALPTLVAERNALEHDFMLAFYELAFLIGCSFGVPVATTLWRGWQKRRSDEQVSFLERHDAATRLFNRTHFMGALDRHLPRAAASRQLTALHLVDIDRFRAVNDALGSIGADALIGAVADRLREAAGPDDVVGRLGGDEFVLAQGGLRSRDEADRMAHDIRGRLARPFRIAGEDRSITASIGVAVAPTDGEGAGELLQAADTAMRRAKADGRDAVRLYHPAMDEALQRRRLIESAVQRAVATGGFSLHFQPVFAAQTGVLVGFEALLRLNDQGGQPLPPADFIPVAEEMGLIDRIGAWVLDEACRAAATWPDSLMVAVNLSPRQLDSNDICAVVKRALETSGLPAHRLELELTESVLLQDTHQVLDQLVGLKALGLSLAMDDFGTGYSSLSTLWRFPFDKLKIDRSFVMNLSATDENMTDILRTIISLGRSLKLKVTAEGVETEAQADVLKEFSCDLLQGFHYGRPTPGDELDDIVYGAAPDAQRPAYTFKGRFGAFAA